MRDRERRGVRPSLERFESRELLSAITDLLVSQSMGAHGGSPIQTVQATMANQFLTPTGLPKPGQVRRNSFRAVFSGPFIQRPGFYTDEASRTNILGVGFTKYSLHADLQLGALVPTDPTAPTAGTSASFDRNINSNSSLGIDLTGSQATGVDAAGRPTQFNWTIDDNTSAGIYVEAVGQGTVNIQYIPNNKHTPGILSQGQAIVTITGQIYSLGVANQLRVLGSQNNLDSNKISF
jgi:hypothetical protein